MNRVLPVSRSWSSQLDFTALSKALDFVDKERDKYTIYPADKNILNAFVLTSYETARVVIMGQDPYPGVDKAGVPHAHGLAFSSQSSEIPASLKNIYKELASEFGRPCNRTGDLSDWAEQGVLLLNSSLSVRKGEPGSHGKTGVWDPVIASAIKSISDRNVPTVFMLWGNDALQIYPYILNKHQHLILEAMHPSPMSAPRGFFGCDHFIQANRWLRVRDMDPIFWI